MNGKLRTILAFSILIAAVAAGFILDYLDKPADVYPNEDTKIMLYGEALMILYECYSRNLILAAAAVFFGVGHIGIHYMHQKELRVG